MTWICSRCRTRFEERRTRCPHDGRRVVQDLGGQVVGGRYTLRELLGVGGMDSSVWLAWQQSIQRAVAIKLLPPADDPSTERFARGARIASNLSHPNITVVHDYGTTDDGHLFLVMELLDGDTLHKALHQTHLPPARTIHIIDQVLRALDHAHRKNIVHRDIKPGNLYLTQQGDAPDFVKVLDFGIARYIDSSEDPVDKSEITMERQICGTPQYMAPEQVAFGQVDARTDIYALGVVMYRMLTGRLPFTSNSHHELFRMHLHSAPPPFQESKPDLDAPPELEGLVMRALAKSPDERFASAAEMRMALRQVRNQMGLPPELDEPSMPSSTHGWSMEANRPPARRGNGWLYAALVILAAAVVALAVIRRPLGPVEPPPDEKAAAATGQPTAGAEKASPPVAKPDAAPRPDAAPPAAKPDAAPKPDAAAPAPDAAPPEPDAEADDGPVYHRVSVYSQPKGAEVYWGGRSIGRTPLQTRLTNGSHTLTLKLAGYEDATWSLRASGRSARRYVRTLELTQVAPPPPAEPEPDPEPVAQPDPTPRASQITLDDVPDPGGKAGGGKPSGGRIPILGGDGKSDRGSGKSDGRKVETLN